MSCDKRDNEFTTTTTTNVNLDFIEILQVDKRSIESGLNYEVHRKQRKSINSITFLFHYYCTIKYLRIIRVRFVTELTFMV